jgi:hypothetical protein
MCFCHDVLIHYRSKNKGPTNHGLKPLNPGAKINLSSFKLVSFRYFAIVMESCLTCQHRGGEGIVTTVGKKRQNETGEDWWEGQGGSDPVECSKEEAIKGRVGVTGRH